jgi:hypothetical protein
MVTNESICDEDRQVLEKLLTLIDAVNNFKSYETDNVKNTLIGWINGLYSLAKFQVGDRVRLKKALKPEPESGWYSYRKCFSTKNYATVREVDWRPADKDRSGCFIYLVRFDKSVWVSSDDKKVRPCNPKDLPSFHMREDKLTTARKRKEHPNEP